METQVEESSSSSGGRCHACGCVGPNPGSAAMSMEDALEEFKTLNPASMWLLSSDGKRISRKFTCRNWQAAMRVLNDISVIAERKDIQHHPDLHLTSYRDIEIVLSTHAANGLTSYDFLLARNIDHVKIDFSPKWLKDHPTANGCQLAFEDAEESNRQKTSEDHHLHNQHDSNSRSHLGHK